MMWAVLIPPAKSGPPNLASLPLSLTPASSYDELRAGFAAAVSHELRTPLARLLSVVESALFPEADVESIVATVRTEIAAMAELIDDVLLISQLENPDLIMGTRGTVALTMVIEVADQFLDAARQAGVTIDISGDESARVPIRESMFRAVVRNLIENAVRYAGPGTTLQMSVRGDEGLLELVASDDGAGVPDEALSRLFERFYRADPARHARGTGLGLAIVKHVVMAAGGHVEASGSEGKGLTIRCTFPTKSHDMWGEATPG